MQSTSFGRLPSRLRVAAWVLLLVPLFTARAGDSPPAAAALTGMTLAVANCNDSGPGSLRATVAAAASGDVIDMRALACREIDLTSGAIEIAQDDLSFVGGPPALMKVDAGRNSSVFRHSGRGTLYFKRMNIARGIRSSDTDPRGGCIYSAGNVELVNSIVHGCRTRGIRGVIYGFGGGIYAKGSVKLVYSRVVYNIVRQGYGGAIYAGGGLAAFHSRICRNQVTGGVGIALSFRGLFARYTTVCDNKGGGIWAQDGSIVIANSTVSGNVGSNIVFLSAVNTGSTSILNSTISGNTDTYGTPILDLQRNSSKSISNSTIAFNQQLERCGPASGTVRVMGPEPALLDSTIVSNNLCNGAPGYGVTRLAGTNTMLVGADNLVTGPESPDLPLPPGTIFADPQLAVLADNGGPTLTHALPDGSLAIDAGNNEAGLQSDQRGPCYPRVRGSQADIGAYER